MATTAPLQTFGGLLCPQIKWNPSFALPLSCCMVGPGQHEGRVGGDGPTFAMCSPVCGLQASGNLVESSGRRTHDSERCKGRENLVC